jgi:hypothetical protein
LKLYIFGNTGLHKSTIDTLKGQKNFHDLIVLSGSYISITASTEEIKETFLKQAETLET